MTAAARRHRAVVVAVGSGGDVAPLAAAAGQLAARGLRTTLMAPQRYAGLTPDGVDFRAAGADDVFESVFSRPDVWTAARGLSESWRYYGAAAHSIYEQIAQGWSPDDTVLVASSFAVGARLAARAHGFLDTTVHLSPGVVFSHERPPRWPAASIPPWWPRWLQAGAAAAAERFAIDPVIRRALGPALRAAGVPDEGRLFSRFLHSPHRVAYLFPTWFAAAAGDWPPSGWHAGFGRPAGLVRALSPEVGDFVHDAGPPPAVITAGTAVDKAPAWVDRVAEALMRHGHRVLVLGRHATRVQPDASSRRMTAPPVPLADILPRAQLLVHHGGIGTAVDAMRAGVPQWLFPSAHDQADNAQRLCELGVARRFAPGAPAAVLHQAAASVASAEMHAAATAAQHRLSVEPDGLALLADRVLCDVEDRPGRCALSAAARADRGPWTQAWPSVRAPEAP